MTVKAKPIIVAPRARSSFLSAQMRDVRAAGTVTLFAALLAMVYLLPLAYSLSTSVRTQVAETGAPFWPAKGAKYSYQGQEFDIYQVPTDSGLKQWALIKKGREQST